MFSKITALLERRRRESQTAYELSLLSDRDLSDLGITRTDIKRLARESAENGVIDLYEWRDRPDAGSAPLAAEASLIFRPFSSVPERKSTSSPRIR